MIDVFRDSGFAVSDPLGAGTDRARVPDGDRPGRAAALRATRERGRGGGGALVPRPLLGGRHRRVAPAGHGRPRDAPQHPRRRVHRRPVRGQPASRLRAVRPRLPDRRGRARRSRARRDRGAGRVGRRGCAAVRREGRARARRALGRLRRDGFRRRSSCQHELLGRLPRSGMRLVGPNCLGVINTGPSVRLNATFAPSFPPDRADRLPVAERRAGTGGRRSRARPRARPLLLRVQRQQGGHLRQRPPPVLGAGRRDRPDRALPRVVREPEEVRSARAPSRSHASRSSRSRAGARRRGHGPPAHTRARCRGVRRDGRRALPPGRRDPRRHACRSSSTWPSCSTPNRSRAAGASAS